MDYFHPKMSDFNIPVNHPGGHKVSPYDKLDDPPGNGAVYSSRGQAKFQIIAWESLHSGLLQSNFYGFCMGIQSFDLSQANDIFCLPLEGFLGIMNEAGFFNKVIDGKG